MGMFDVSARPCVLPKYFLCYPWPKFVEMVNNNGRKLLDYKNPGTKLRKKELKRIIQTGMKEIKYDRKGSKKYCDHALEKKE